MKKNTKIFYILSLFISIIFFIYLYNFYQIKEGFSISDNEIISSVKEIFNNIFNPIKRKFRAHYNNIYDSLQHSVKKFNYNI